MALRDFFAFSSGDSLSPASKALPIGLGSAGASEHERSERRPHDVSGPDKCSLEQ